MKAARLDPIDVLAAVRPALPLPEGPAPPMDAVVVK